MDKVDLAEARNRLIELIDRVEAGESIDITRNGKTVARLSPPLRVAIMAAVTIRNLPEETHHALKVRAAEHNRSTEAEMRAILEGAALPQGRLRFGTALSEIGRNVRLTNADVEVLERVRDTVQAKPLPIE